MAGFRHGKGATISVAGQSETAYCDSIDISFDIDSAETSTFGNSYKTFLTGQGALKLSASGSYDIVANGPSAIFTTNLFSDSVLFVVSLNSNSTERRYTFTGQITSYQETASVGDAVKFSVEITSTGSVTIGAVP